MYINPNNRIRIKLEAKAQEPKVDFRKKIHNTLNSGKNLLPALEDLDQGGKLVQIISFMISGTGYLVESRNYVDFRPYQDYLDKKGRQAVIKEFNESRPLLELLLRLMNRSKFLPDGYLQNSDPSLNFGKTAADAVDHAMDSVSMNNFKFDERDRHSWELIGRVLRAYCLYEAERVEKSNS